MMIRVASILAVLFGLSILPLRPPAARAATAPICAGSDPAVADPSAIHGVFAANVDAPQWLKQASLLDRYLAHDPTLCGANLIVPWSSVDRGPGEHPRYVWSFVDRAAQPWVATGKMINLIVWGVAEQVSQQWNGPVTPAYVLRSAPTITCPGANHPVTPVYWDAGYEQNYRALMRAVVQRYGRDPHVGYIRFGIGAGGEDYPANGLRGACLQQWKAHGLSEQRWQRYSVSTVRFEATLHSPKQLIVGLNDLAGFPGLNLPRAVAAAAVAHGFGFGTQGLSLHAAALLQAKQPCYADWCALFQTYAGRVPLEVQTFTASNPGASGPTGPLPQVMALAWREKAQIFELYPQEWLVANDPSYPGYAQYHLSYQRALATASRLLNGSGPASAPTPAAPDSGQIQVLRNVPYVQPASADRSGDLYLPAGQSQARPAVVVIHGGAWVGGSKDAADTVFLSESLAQHGDVAFNINYRLVGHGGEFPNDVQDVKDAVAFLAPHAGQWHIDAHHIAAVGTSAGGHLALMAGYTPNTGIFAPPQYPGSDVRLAAVGSFFGPTDFTAFPATAPASSVTAVAHYLGASYAQNPAVYRQASPVTYSSTAVPTIMEHGTADATVPYSQSTELNGLLQQHGVASELVSVPGGGHGLLLGRPGPQRDMELSKLGEFLDKEL